MLICMCFLIAVIPVSVWKLIVIYYVLMVAIRLLILFRLAFTYLAAMQSVFGSTSISLHLDLLIILVASSVLLLVEFEKSVFGTRSKINSGF